MIDWYPGKRKKFGWSLAQIKSESYNQVSRVEFGRPGWNFHCHSLFKFPNVLMSIFDCWEQLTSLFIIILKCCQIKRLARKTRKFVRLQGLVSVWPFHASVSQIEIYRKKSRFKQSKRCRSVFLFYFILSFSPIGKWNNQDIVNDVFIFQKVSQTYVILNEFTLKLERDMA